MSEPTVVDKAMNLEYEDHKSTQFKKLMTVINAGKLNGALCDLTIETHGTDPHCSIKISAHWLEKFLKDPLAL